MTSYYKTVVNSILPALFQSYKDHVFNLILVKYSDWKEVLQVLSLDEYSHEHAQK